MGGSDQMGGNAWKTKIPGTQKSNYLMILQRFSTDWVHVFVWAH